MLILLSYIYFFVLHTYQHLRFTDQKSLHIYRISHGCITPLLYFEKVCYNFVPEIIRFVVFNCELCNFFTTCSNKQDVYKFLPSIPILLKDSWFWLFFSFLYWSI